MSDEVKQTLKVIDFEKEKPSAQGCIDAIVEDGLDDVTEIVAIVRKKNGSWNSYSNGIKSSTKVWLAQHYILKTLEIDRL